LVPGTDREVAPKPTGKSFYFTMDQSNSEHTEPTERSYTTITAEKELGFDPLKDLNLPGSYDEVVIRFKKLQGERAQEVLN
jgi:hypothetical protein